MESGRDQCAKEGCYGCENCEGQYSPNRSYKSTLKTSLSHYSESELKKELDKRENEKNKAEHNKPILSEIEVLKSKIKTLESKLK